MLSRKRRAPASRKSPRALEPVWTDRALQNLADIEAHIAADSPQAAVRWIDKLIAAGVEAAGQPLLGRIVPEKGRDDIREVLVKKYRIVYQVLETRAAILTVFEGHKLLADLDLQQDDDA